MIIRAKLMNPLFVKIMKSKLKLIKSNLMIKRKLKRKESKKFQIRIN